MRRLLLAFPLAVTVGVACGPDSGGYNGTDAGLGGVGAGCLGDSQCRSGLACLNNLCEPGHASGDGTPCTISAECQQGEYCGPARTCAKSGSGASGDNCGSDADCQSGLRCNIVGFTAVCQAEGTGDVGGACTQSADCFGGLACADNVCTPLPPNPNGPPPLGIPTWKGETCADDTGPVKAYFRVPRGTGDGDFYRLPFPNDVRVKNGKIDLTNHPTPGPGLLGFDVVDRYLRDIEKNADGFSTYPTVTFRFSGGVNLDSLKPDGRVRFVDITQDADVGYSWIASTAHNKYVCDNWLALRPPGGQPLAPGHTYAMVVFTGVTDNSAAAVVRDDDLTTLLATSAPSDATLAAAYTAYAPFRAWLTTKTIDPATVLLAAVFTTGHPQRIASKLPAATAAAAAPTSTGWIRCGDAPSPCPQATGDRACGTPDPDFDELHAMVTLPIFQTGTEPYLTPTDGGDFVIASDGTPTFQRTEDVCMALTVPKGAAMPVGGWPLVIYGHGTGGSFRNHVTGGVAKQLAAVDDGQGGTVRMAVLGIDQPEHGTRRGASTDSPNTLFYNFANPGAARGNPLQGAADQLSLVRFAKTFTLLAAQSPTGSDVKFGTILYWGHSQGATEGSISIPYGTDVPSVVLSGQGASLLDALLTKKNPVNVAAAVPYVLQDLDVGIYHPVLSLLENAIEVADPLVHASAMSIAPPSGVSPRNLLQPFGQNDTYSPPITQLTYVLAAGLGVVAPAPDVVTQDKTLGSMAQITAPAIGNLVVASKSYTVVVREYLPPSTDGHFVAFDNANGKKDVGNFLCDAAQNKTPAVGR